MLTHSRILAWRILWTKEPGGVTVHGVAKGQKQLKPLSMHACMQGSFYHCLGKTMARSRIVFVPFLTE